VPVQHGSVSGALRDVFDYFNHRLFRSLVQSGFRVRCSQTHLGRIQWEQHEQVHAFAKVNHASSGLLHECECKCHVRYDASAAVAEVFV
jgi:hypothetical protein